MGLDMYLTAKRRFYKHQGEDAALDALNANPMFRLPGATGNFGGPERAVVGVEVDAIYWRKANHIHAWFVQNVQGGEDECQPHEVSLEQLTALRDACANVLADRAKAAETLPTQSGFFFGGTEYDKHYFADTERTHTALTAMLADPAVQNHDWQFTYCSSW